MTGGYRVCPACGANEAISPGQAAWPAEWLCPSCGRSALADVGIPLLAPNLADTRTGMEPSSFGALEAVERGHFWFEPRNRLILGLIGKHAPKAESVLEIGCGSGFVLDAIARSRPWRRVVGAELHPSGLQIARKRLAGRAEFVQMDARRAAFRETFDLVGAFDVLEHIVEDAAALSAICEALKPGGTAILAVPQHPWLWSDADEKALHARRYRPGELEEKAVDAGLQVTFSGSYTTLLLPLMAASRLMRRTPSADAGGQAVCDVEFHLARPVNALLRAILDVEVSATLCGVRFPWGGSRVVVARRP